MEASPVREMFNGRSVFITGASGFIGKVLLEKLLRTYPEINKIYILLRVKKNMQPFERLHKQLLKVPIFDQIRASSKADELFAKIIVVSGDISEPGLGISEQDMQMLLQDPTLAIVFHAAATIKFDEPLKASVSLNLMATQTIIDISRKLPNLISLCHVSTAYVNSDMKQNQDIEEKIYPIKESPQLLIKLTEYMDEDMMQLLKRTFVDQRPNTYTYTKALAEHLIASEATDLPVAIVRPSIVIASWREPFSGWIDNLNGPTGLILAIGKGLLRSIHTIREVKADVIPVDIVINSMIAAAYYAAKTNGKLKTKSFISNGMSSNIDPSEIKQQVISKQERFTNNGSTKTKENTLDDKMGLKSMDSKEPPIFQCVSGDLRPIYWGGMEDLFMPIIRKYPSCQVLRYPYGSFKSNKYHDLITRLFVHYLPALIIDLLCLVMGKKRQLLSTYYKLHCAIAALTHFTTHNYNFKSKNLIRLRNELSDLDREQLYMNIEDLDWKEFWDSYVLGARRYVLKEDDRTLPEARKSFRRAFYIEMILRALLLVLLVSFILPYIYQMAAILSNRPMIKRAFRAIKLCS